MGWELAVVFVERETQVARLRGLLADCLGARGSVVAVSGPIASGKTELLHVFGEYAQSRGAVVLHAVGRCAEQKVPLGVMGQIFRHARFSPDERDRALRLPGDGGVAPCDADLLPAGRMPARVAQTQWELLRGLSERTPLVVVVDDLHFADAASLDSLIHIGGLIRTSRVLLVVAEPDAPSEGDVTERSWRTSLLRRHFTRIRVRPLSVRATGEMLAGLIGPAPAAGRAVESWHRLSGGNPLLLRALAEDHHATLPRSAEPVVGEEFGRAVDACVRRAGARIRDAARALAVLDASGSADRLAQLLGRSRTWVDETLEAMNGFGVLDAGRYRHPAARAAVLAGMPAAERAALHRDAARLLHDGGEAVSTVAVHLVAGRSEEPWAFPVALAAAREALRRDDTRFAGGCLDVASEACAEEEQRVTVAMLRSLVDFRTDPDTACRRLRPLVTALREGRLSGCQSVSLLGRLLWNGSGEEITVALRQLERSSHVLDATSTAEYHAAREWLHVSHPALLAGASARTRPERPARTADGSPPRIAGVLNRLLRSGPDQESVRSAELVLQTTTLDDGSFGTIQMALSVLVYADRCALAVSWCDALLRESAERAVPVWQALFSAIRAEIAIRQGDVRLAERHSRRAMALMSPGSWGIRIGSPLSSLLLSATATGTLTDARDTPTAMLPEQMFQTRYGVQYLHARGRQRLSLNLLHGALDDLTRCGRLMREWDIDLPAFVPWRNAAVETLLRLGRTDEARRLAAEQLTLVSPAQPRARGTALRSLASVSDPRRRTALLREAVDLLGAGGDRLELAYALADLSEVHTRAGQNNRARMVARQALDIAEENGLDPLIRRLKAREARGTGEERGEGVTVLSGSELQVAALAVSGHSNREIAEKLFITVSTVEQHLTHAYRKLRVKGRADLPRSLQQVEPSAGRARERARPAPRDQAAVSGGTGSPSSPRRVPAS
ncbi:AAA family ATPase [Streptomyces sp. NPDC087420]|uniref:helix-turn-helix transcriptional regulator n=1 Tax=Streptomyces sp. NPDC087420 TaxID=3365785 RepID=UPI0038341E5A